MSFLTSGDTENAPLLSFSNPTSLEDLANRILAAAQEISLVDVANALDSLLDRLLLLQETDGEHIEHII